MGREEYRPATSPPTSGKRSVQARTGGGRGTPAAPAETPDLEATDAAKALADQHGIDLATVKGSGADGRITKDDVQEVVDAQSGDDSSTANN